MCCALASLCLEWNAVGLIENAFAVFCDGLGANSTLVTLDIRSNQISHVGAAELANALKRNASLRSLGLCVCLFVSIFYLCKCRSLHAYFKMCNIFLSSVLEML
jgi:hypothetical protein